jgi:hypothetical protein
MPAGALTPVESVSQAAAALPAPPLRPVVTKRRFNKGLAGGAAATADFKAPIVPSGQLPASLAISFTTQPITGPVSR